jgi:hypothetical protein
MDNREKLRQKLKKKQQKRQNVRPEPEPEPDPEPANLDFAKMMEQVNTILKTNPQMVSQISKCVSNVMGNKDLMASLVNEVNQEIQDPQIFESNTPGEEFDASEKLFKQ